MVTYFDFVGHCGDKILFPVGVPVVAVLQMALGRQTLASIVGCRRILEVAETAATEDSINLF